MIYSKRHLPCFFFAVFLIAQWVLTTCYRLVWYIIQIGAVLTWYSYISTAESSQSEHGDWTRNACPAPPLEPRQSFVLVSHERHNPYRTWLDSTNTKRWCTILSSKISGFIARLTWHHQLHINVACVFSRQNSVHHISLIIRVVSYHEWWPCCLEKGRQEKAAFFKLEFSPKTRMITTQTVCSWLEVSYTVQYL